MKSKSNGLFLETVLLAVADRVMKLLYTGKFYARLMYSAESGIAKEKKRKYLWRSGGMLPWKRFESRD